jgi:hypothetical protein
VTRRERLENKLEKRQGWAAGATAKSNAAYNRSHALTAGIPFGQPVLVGHHSERRHRNALDKSWNALGKSVEMQKLAEHHESKAAGITAQLERTIFSDDDNAVEAIEMGIASREAERERMKKVNALYRKGNAEGLAEMGFNLEDLRTKLKDAYTWCQQPYPAYELSNLGGRITADKKRLDHIKRMNQEQAEATENGVKIDRHEGGYCSVRFADKPDYSVIRALKDASFRWGAGSWFGQTENLPGCVAELEGC